ncbi:hypothetical protein NFI96_016669 [Prochilodus magdalenae]|nr:hypothetical protein NFI96_016669 [Prochilodus magdalenae]
MTPKEFMAVLERSLALDKAAEQKVVDPAGVTVFYRCPQKSFSGMERQILKLQSGLEASDCVPINLSLSTLFNITKGTYFSKIQEVIIRIVKSLLPLEMRDAVNNYTIYSLTSSVHEELLKQMSFIFVEKIFRAPSWDDSVEIEIMDVAKKLLLTTVKKLQDFCLICALCGWLRASRGSLFNVHDEVEALVHSLTTKVAGAIFQSMLSISSEGTSKDALYSGLDTPLNNFIQAVDQKIRAESLSSPSNSNRTEEQPSPQEQNDFATKEIHPVASCFDITEKVWSSDRPRCERVLESIIFNHINVHDEANTTEKDAQKVFCFSSKHFFVEASRMVSQIINSESAASEIVSALVSQLKSTLGEDCVLADPSVAPALYTTQVQMVSDKIVKSIKPTLMEVVLIDMFRRSDEAMTTQKNTDQLEFDLLSSSRQILKGIIDYILVVLSQLGGPTECFTQFLYSLLDYQNLYMWHLSEFFKSSDESSDETSEESLEEDLQNRRRLFKQQNRIKPTTVRTQDLTKKQPIPAEEPSTSQAPSTSAATPVPKKKNLLSKVSAAFTRFFRKGGRPSS